MGASKKRQMRYFDDDWADQIWRGACEVNSGKGAAWALPLAAIAITGARPAALERGIEFSVVEINGRHFVQALIPGVKLRDDRGQPQHAMRWDLKKISTHRKQELRAIVQALLNSEAKKITVQYDAEAISTRLRELSQSIWPRKKYHITSYCFRQLFCAAAKSSGADRHELAMALGHLSADSQGKYSRKRPTKNGLAPGGKLWDEVSATKAIKPQRSQLSRFKKASAQRSAFKRFAANA